MIRILLIIIGTVMLSSYAQAEVLRIAVLEYNGANLEDDNSEAFLLKLSDQTRSAAVNVLSKKNFLILTRENMLEVLKDMGKDSSCIDGECEVEVGRNIGADFIVTGDILKIENTYVLTLKLYETDSGGLLATQEIQHTSLLKVKEDTRTQSEILLSDGLANIVENEKLDEAAAQKENTSTTLVVPNKSSDTAAIENGSKNSANIDAEQTAEPRQKSNSIPTETKRKLEAEAAKREKAAKREAAQQKKAAKREAAQQKKAAKRRAAREKSTQRKEKLKSLFAKLNIEKHIPSNDAGDGVLLDAQLVGTGLSEFPLDTAATTNDQQLWLRSRVLVGWSGSFGSSWQYQAAIETLNAPVAGDFTTLGTTVDDNIFRPRLADRNELAQPLPRALNIAYRGNKWGFRAGMQSFEWGLGILSNDGLGQTRFGAAHQGNTYVRVGGYSLPAERFPGLSLFAATDLVLRDDSASIYAGDVATQAIFGVRSQAEDLEWGALLALRHQQDRPDPFRPVPDSSSMVTPIDGYARWQPIDRLWLEGEAALISGSTDRIYSEQTRGANTAILYYGGVARLSYKDLALAGGGLTPLLEVGHASGDANPTDASAKTFSFHSDYNVGLLLYEQILPRIAARSMERISDPELSKQQAPGLRYGVPTGGVHNSTYLQLCTDWRRDWFLIRAGWLGALSTAPVADAYQTAMNGGYASDHSGNAASEYLLGNELDLRIAADVGPITFSTDAGLFLPGSALAFQEPSWTVVGQLQFRQGELK